jgi:hypothetical protein
MAMGTDGHGHRHTHTHKHTHTHICMCECVCACMCICICIYICMCEPELWSFNDPTLPQVKSECIRRTCDRLAAVDAAAPCEHGVARSSCTRGCRKDRPCDRQCKLSESHFRFDVRLDLQVGRGARAGRCIRFWGLRWGCARLPAASAPGLGSPLPHLHGDWAHPAATSAPGLGSPLPTSAPGLWARQVRQTETEVLVEEICSASCTCK